MVIDLLQKMNISTKKIAPFAIKNGENIFDLYALCSNTYLCLKRENVT